MLIVDFSKEFIKPGAVKVALADFPHDDDPGDRTVAEAVHRAGRLGPDVAAFQESVAEDRSRGGNVGDRKLACSAGFSARPTFLVGRGQPDAAFKGRYVVDAQNYVIFKSLIEKALAPGAER